MTKLGQKPLTQEKSLLQLFWSIWRFLPKGVSFGITDKQFDSTEQSPQPSQTRSFMTTNLSGSASRPRFLRRRFSVAQVCAYINIVTPGISRNSRCTESRSRLCESVVACGKSLRSYISGSSETSAIRSMPSARTECATLSTVIGPSTGWPPVIATASLKRILNVILVFAAKAWRIARDPE